MTTRIAISRIQPDADQPRKKFAEDALEELAGSIKENGLIQAIAVRAAGNGKRGYIIIAGERRWRAHKLLADRGLRSFMSIECHVRKTGAGADTLVKQIAENLNREDIEPMEEARAFARLRDEFGLDASQIAKKLGLAAFRVDWRLSLLNLSPPIARMVESGQIDRQLALESARLPTHRDQTRLVQMVNRGELVGWGTIRNAVDTMLDGSKAADLFGEDAPKPNGDDLRVMTSMERRVEQVALMVSHGWRQGECVIANKVDPDRAALLANKLHAIGGAIRIMERELRNVGAQAKIAMAS